MIRCAWRGLFFFFSSRRRHTRFDCDWSSDVCSSDLLMPEMDGFETCRRIKASATWREIPIVFLTAKTDTGDIVRAFELGAVDYVAKPFNAHELLARVNTHLTLAHLHRENERLLLNVLPASIANKLKQQVGIIDRKSTRLNSSHSQISYAVFC